MIHALLEEHYGCDEGSRLGAQDSLLIPEGGGHDVESERSEAEKCNIALNTYDRNNIMTSLINPSWSQVNNR